MAPSAGPAVGLGGAGAGAAFTGMAFEYPNACATSGGRAPPNRMEKKLRNAREILFKFFSSIESAGLPKSILSPRARQHGRLAKLGQFPPGDVRPVAGRIQFQVGVPVVYGLDRLLGALIEQG